MTRNKYKKGTICKIDTYKIILLFGVLFFVGIVGIVNSNEASAVWDCRDNLQYENKPEYKYLILFGWQDRGECVRGRSGCTNSGDWSDKCSDICTNPEGCGSCEGRCNGDELYYADIWKSKSSNRVISATCRHVKKDGNEDRQDFDDSGGRTSACYPVAFIDGPSSNHKYTVGDSVHFKGRGTDPNSDRIEKYQWNIRTIENNTAKNFQKDIVIKEKEFSKSNLAVGRHVIFLKVTDEVGAKSVWVYKVISIIKKSVVIPDGCVNRNFTIDKGICTFNKGGCTPTASTTINVPYAGTYKIHVNSDRGNNVSKYECQGKEEFYMIINGTKTKVIIDPEACESSGTKHHQLVGNIVLRKGVNVVDIYHEHKVRDLTRRPNPLGSQSLTIESLNLYLKDCPVAGCTGGNPPYGAMWCTNDEKMVTVNTPWQKVNSCTSRKCEYIMPAECGSAHEKSYDKTSELTSPDKRCNKPGSTLVSGSWAASKASLTENGGIAWTWKCKRGLKEVACEAYKNGECNDTPKKSPYKQKEYACKVGSFNSVSLGDIDTKPVLTWKCGTGKSKKSNGSPAAPKYIGDFFSGNADKAPQVAFDNYTPTSGGVNCKCYPEYSYVCSYSDADCSNKCDGYALSVAVATKHDTECFPAEIKSISKTEFNLNKNSNQEECENKQIKCAACGANSAETGEGGIWHESH